MDDQFYTMDNQTAPSYLVGMILCHELYVKGGYKSLKRALECPENDEVFYAFLKREIGIGQEDFNSWMRDKINIYTIKDIPPLQ